MQWAEWSERVGSERPDEGLVRGWFQRAAKAVRAVGRALAGLPVWRGDSELLAVFAAAVTGDPHAFDAGEPAGLLVEHALGEQFERPADGLRPNEARALLLGRAGLQVDQVSSTVLVAHVAAATLAGVEHPMVAAMTACGGAWAVTLGEVRRWSGVRAHRNRAYVVENPPVFEWLLRRLAGEAPERRATLICSGGFLSAASVTLLDLLVGEGPLADTARAVAEGGQAAYQEQLVTMLCQDVLAAGYD
ncbi:MAG: hypothetical protein JWN15_1391 [Firmicutes bacterium]|nr:hypothetical protein [Bacillota bacterium]